MDNRGTDVRTLRARRQLMGPGAALLDQSVERERGLPARLPPAAPFPASALRHGVRELTLLRPAALGGILRGG